MTPKELEIIEQVACRVARKYAARYRVEFDELHSEALAVLVHAHPRYDSEKGDFKSFMNAAATRNLSRYAIHLRAPVSGPNNSKHSKALVGQSKVVSELRSQQRTAREPSPEDRTHSLLLSSKIQKRLGEILSEEERRLVIEHKVLERGPAEIQHEGRDKRQILTILQRARRKIARDETLWRLWREICRG